MNRHHQETRSLLIGPRGPSKGPEADKRRDVVEWALPLALIVTIAPVGSVAE
jgi:hypothetical protein